MLAIPGAKERSGGGVVILVGDGATCREYAVESCSPNERSNANGSQETSLNEVRFRKQLSKSNTNDGAGAFAASQSLTGSHSSEKRYQLNPVRSFTVELPQPPDKRDAPYIETLRLSPSLEFLAVGMSEGTVCIYKVYQSEASNKIRSIYRRKTRPTIRGAPLSN